MGDNGGGANVDGLGHGILEVQAAGGRAVEALGIAQKSPRLQRRGCFRERLITCSNILHVRSDRTGTIV